MQESAIPPDPSASSVPAAPAADSGPAPAPVPAPGAGPMPAASAPAGGPAAASPVFAYDDGEPFDVEAYFDPDYGPPEGEDAWLAQVASPVADEYLAAHQPAPAAREVLAAGFTHRDREPGARGWAAGGALDVMEPGPVLAGFADDAISGGLPTLSDDELIGVLCAARRLASRAAGIELAAVTDLNARREAHAVKVRDRRQAEHVGDEIAAALRLTCRAADKLLALAVDVTRLPAVLKALADGRIDLPKAGVYAAELAGLPDLPAAAIAAVTITEAAGLTTGELGALLRRLVLAHDPDAARKRRQKAEKGARVETWAEAAGTAALAGRDLPPADALAADKNIDDHARQLKKAGAPGTLEWLRAQVFTALLTSQPLSTLLPGGNGHGSRNSGGDDGPRGDNGHPRGDNDNPGGDDGPGEGGGGIRRPWPGTGPTGGPSGAAWPAGQSTTAGLGGSVNLTIPLSTWLGLTGLPGEAAGLGPLDAGISRDLADRIAATPGNRWCLTITGPDGRVIGHGCARPRAGPPPREDFLLRKTEPPGWARSPTYEAYSPPGAAGPASDGTTRWLAGLKISWLETMACGHARETRAYQPSAKLRHLIKTRDRTCMFPGCRRPARQCDDDHTLPFDQGGRTCECNMSPLCRRHHAAKQAPGWHLLQPQPGTLNWTMPNGRTRTITPRPYSAQS